MKRFFARSQSVALAFGASLTLTAAAWAEDLESTVRQAIGAAKLQSQAEVGVSVVDVETLEPLVSIQANRSLIPASNLKLLTSGAALMVLGPDFQFRTELLADGSRVIIRGSGDPGLGDPKLLAARKWSVESLLDQLAGAAEKAGIKGVTEVIVDDRVFDRFTINPGWPQKQLNLWYCAPITGLNFHTNCLEIYPRAGDRTGAPVQVATQPSAPWIQIDTSSSRTTRDGATSLWAQQVPSEAVYGFKLFGTLRTTAAGIEATREPIEVTVDEPGLMLGKLLRDALIKRGLVVTPSVTVRLAQMAETFPGEKTFAVVATPLATVLQRCNTDSQNLYAEALVKRIANQVTGQPGSWANGTTVVRGKLIETLGADIGDVRLSDGSGLSRENSVPPITLARWLAALHRNDHLRRPMLDSMATADDGRLEGRFKDRRLTARVHAKTGYIRGVLCLSGYVTLESPTDHTDDRTLSFSILINNTQSSISQARELQEDIVQALDRHLVRNAPKAQPALGG